MKTLSALVAALCLASATFAAVPENLDGYVYYESGRESTRTIEFAAVFSSSGSYTQIYRNDPGANATGGFGQLLNPIDGKFAYRKIDDTTAELTLTDSLGAGKRNLRFVSNLSGIAAVTSTSVAIASFRFAPLSSRSPLVNCSNRSFASSTNLAFTGFVITGDEKRTVLVRAIGPGLAPFGIVDFLRNPLLSVVRSTPNAPTSRNNDWSDESAESITRTATAVGAFPLPTASKDAALILSLAPGAYVAQVTSPDAGDSGQALIEVYILP